MEPHRSRSYQRPLGWREEPQETTASEGRFLILADKYLDPYLFRRGKKITVAGEILGEKIKPLGEMDYRYPILSSKQIYLWPEYYYRPYPYIYYDPWWGYPYGWGGIGFGYYYFPHSSSPPLSYQCPKKLGKKSFYNSEGQS